VTSTLDQLKPGDSAVVMEVRADDQPVCLRLQELGLVQGTPVLVLSRQGGVVILVGDQRLCLSAPLAQAVQVLAL
jgi:Fe2+ transport system protein FeoA